MGDKEKEEFLKTLSELRAGQARLELAITGDEEMGQLGIIPWLKDHHKRIKKLESWRAKWIWLATGALWVTGLLYMIYRDVAIPFLTK